jgi:putative flavoprotein involved in K+ transport
MNTQQRSERVETLVIGAGQAGLSVGYHLSRLGLPYLILDAAERIGDAWRSRWDSLRLITSARYNGRCDNYKSIAKKRVFRKFF